MPLAEPHLVHVMHLLSVPVPVVWISFEVAPRQRLQCADTNVQ